MDIPVKRWQRDSLYLPSRPLLLTLSFHWLFQEELCTGNVIFFSHLFHFGCENVAFLDGRPGGWEEGAKESLRKSNKVSSSTQWDIRPLDGSQTLTRGFSLINIKTDPGWIESTQKTKEATKLIPITNLTTKALTQAVFSIGKKKLPMHSL